LDDGSVGPSVIPVVEVGALFDAGPTAWGLTDRTLYAAAREVGFACIRGLPGDQALGPAARTRLLGIFALEEAKKRRLYRRKFSPHSRNIYRGWFPLQPGNLTYKEGIDMGGDVAHVVGITASDDPLREPTPLPEEEDLPGWRAAVATYYQTMEHIAGILMRSLARSLGLADDYFDESFRHGLSTLRLIRYPPRNASEFHLVGAPHTDSGFLTLLAQDGVGGLQARSRDGRWIDVPPLEGTLVVNFGQVLEQWSAGRIRATEHRVLGSGGERYSIPFFYEARADAIIAPLPIDSPGSFPPFAYGDFLWKRITSFVEFRGMDDERPKKSR
jgi:isopenicillin N synthase-like dioxygenase